MIRYDIMALLQQTDEAIIPAAKGPKSNFTGVLMA